MAASSPELPNPAGRIVAGGVPAQEHSMKRIAACLTALSVISAGAALPAASTALARQPLWTMQHSSIASDLADISCASASECFAVGSHAAIIKTENGGR